jgi:hypothetical protein
MFNRRSRRQGVVGTGSLGRPRSRSGRETEVTDVQRAAWSACKFETKFSPITLYQVDILVSFDSRGLTAIDWLKPEAGDLRTRLGAPIPGKFTIRRPGRLEEKAAKVMSIKFSTNSGCECYFVR